VLKVELSCQEVLLHNIADFDIRGELQVISPWGTWDAIPRATFNLEVPAGQEIAVPLTVKPKPGSHWMLVKCMWFGRVSYSAAVRAI